MTRFKILTMSLIAPLIILLDQWTKYLVRENIPYGSSVSVIPGFFDLVHYTNTGAAFGMLSDAHAAWREPFFYCIAFVALIAIVVMWRRCAAHERLMPIILSLLVGGVIGNLVDRFSFGKVTDFLSVHFRDVIWHFSIAAREFTIPLDWPAFNVADSAITVSMVLLLFGLSRDERNPPESRA